jgi:WD40 repeat protein
VLTTIETDKPCCIRGLSRSINCGGFWLSSNRPGSKAGLTQNYLLASDVNGYITIFDIGAPGKEKNTKRIGNTQGRPKQRIVLWRDHGREIISGDADGLVTFWNSKDGAALYVLKAHDGAITQMRWNEDSQQLITCSKDKSIKIWQLPDQWIDE